MTTYELLDDTLMDFLHSFDLFSGSARVVLHFLGCKSKVTKLLSFT